MKLVEIVVLMGTQCVSPVQHTPHVTVANKVPCAVVIHRDTVRHTVAVVPASKVDHPKVRAALGLPVNAASAPLLTGSLPENAPPAAKPSHPKAAASSAGTPVAEKVPMQSGPPQPGAETVIADEQPAQIEPTNSTPDQLTPGRISAAGEPAKAAEPPAATDTVPKPRAAIRSAAAESAANAAAAKRSDKCLGAARPQWYTNKKGKRRYHCVIPGKN